MIQMGDGKSLIHLFTVDSRLSLGRCVLTPQPTQNQIQRWLAVHWSDLLYYITLHYIMLYYIISYYITLHYMIWYHIVLYYIDFRLQPVSSWDFCRCWLQSAIVWYRPPCRFGEHLKDYQGLLDSEKDGHGEIVHWNSHRIQWWENLQETSIFNDKNHGFL